MSRLDEALRRAGDPVSTENAVAGRQSAFESAWRFGDEIPSPSLRERGALLDASGGSFAERRHVGVRFSAAWEDRLISSAADPILSDQFRRLAATLIHGQRDGHVKIIMVTSATPGEGKTLTALNLALVLSQSFRRRVLLIDADLRRPRISEVANLAVSGGLAEALKAPTDEKVPLVQLSETLSLLPAGRPDPDPLSGLTSSRMHRLLTEASDRFDWVIVDTPPVGAAADADLLSAMAHGTVLVVRAGQTSYDAVRRAIETLGRERILGVVLNGVDEPAVQPYRGYAAYDAAAVTD
jgi:receptor protein-tyrosine kinase